MVEHYYEIKKHKVFGFLVILKAEMEDITGTDVSGPYDSYEEALESARQSIEEDSWQEWCMPWLTCRVCQNTHLHYKIAAEDDICALCKDSVK